MVGCTVICRNLSINRKICTFEGGSLGLKGPRFEMPQFLLSEEVMVTSDADLQVREQLPVIRKVLRDIVRLEAIDYFFVSPVASFEERDVLDHIKCEGISCGDVVNWHFDGLLPS